VAFNAWVDRLAEVSGIAITDFDAYLAALRARHDFFHANGCRLSDHGLDTIYADDWTAAGIRAIFAKVRSGKALEPAERSQFKSRMLHEGALMDHAKGWVQQFHIGALRNNNTRLFTALGPDKGFDSIGDACYAAPLARFLDRLDRTDQLARTILYNLNPRDNEVLATMIGNFQDGSVPGKLQFGSGWWFLDQKDGMEKQIEALSNMGLLSRFVGMLTDSRSFLSYTRHEYFRRTLCGLLGREMKAGLIPDDLELVGNLVRDVCYRNAARYFDFGLDADDRISAPAIRSAAVRGADKAAKPAKAARRSGKSAT
jgi:glucuronate isomerase